MRHRLPKADVNWLSQQLTAVVDSLMPTSEECARQAAAFDKVCLQHQAFLSMWPTVLHCASGLYRFWLKHLPLGPDSPVIKKSFLFHACRWLAC